MTHTPASTPRSAFAAYFGRTTAPIATNLTAEALAGLCARAPLPLHTLAAICALSGPGRMHRFLREAACFR